MSRPTILTEAGWKCTGSIPVSLSLQALSAFHSPEQPSLSQIFIRGLLLLVFRSQPKRGPHISAPVLPSQRCHIFQPLASRSNDSAHSDEKLLLRGCEIISSLEEHEWW